MGIRAGVSPVGDGTVSVDVERSIQGDTGQIPGRTSAPKRKTAHALSLAAKILGETLETWKAPPEREEGGGGGKQSEGAEESEWGYPVAVTVDVRRVNATLERETDGLRFPILWTIDMRPFHSIWGQRARVKRSWCVK